MAADADAWRCPWCGEIAESAPEMRTMCQSRQCACGAIGICAPLRDSDEIVDDAVSIFGVHFEPTSTGFTDLQLVDVARAGVDIRGGRLVLETGEVFPRLRWIWFRRGAPTVPAN